MKRDWLTLAFGLVLVWAVVGLSVRHNMNRPTPAAPAEASTPVPAPPTAPAVEPISTPAPPTEVPVSGARALIAKTKPRAVAPERPPDRSAEVPAEETGIALQVQSDVPGASVFVDREFVGTTPLNLRGLTAGPKQLNVTAAGHEGYVATINLTEGANRVTVEFMKVHLNASVPVIHRHAMGSCQGLLAASPKGVSYDTPNRDDAFAVTFTDVDEFELDYLKKNLRVRRRAGRTWNFTNDNADALFAFHRDVNKAREKLAAAR
jgi:hypothetical protein